MFGTPGNDALRERGTNARQPCDFAHVRLIQINSLPRQERTGELSRAAGRFSQRIGTWDGRRLQLDVTWWS
ncbi:MAG: hypothetical protein AUI86_01395 [Gemmatimonadetes bacterium 13_1_40CM_3_66_12]|nr:MAG: hypothetical protein AUI86_01395 [Gemmatimonadetes bacterium 13_1_40CM_3_66_12]